MRTQTPDHFIALLIIPYTVDCIRDLFDFLNKFIHLVIVRITLLRDFLLRMC